MERLASIASQLNSGRSLRAQTAGAVAGRPPADVDCPPNILLLITDQQTHTLLSCAGTKWLSTPHSDRLAAQGARFTRAYATNPVCVPSRFSMFTGRMPSAIGLRHNQTPKGAAVFTHADDEQSLGHLLQRAGYRTLYGGKTHWPIGLNPERLGFQSSELHQLPLFVLPVTLHSFDKQSYSPRAGTSAPTSVSVWQSRLPRCYEAS